jgi:hypothetical protein
MLQSAIGISQSNIASLLATIGILLSHIGRLQIRDRDRTK